MLAQFQGTAMLLFGLLFVSGVILSWISDKVVSILGIVPCESCVEADCEECFGGDGPREESRIFFGSRICHKIFSPFHLPGSCSYF